MRDMTADSNRDRHFQEVLKTFIEENPGIKPDDSLKALEIPDFIITNAPQGSRSRWVAALIEPSQQGTRRQGFRSGAIALILSGLAVAAILVYGIFYPNFIKSIGNPAEARGLITFLFSVGTIAVILIISISTFWSHIDEVEKRAGLAKDVLTILIGIFGTIIGFYFGSGEISGTRTNTNMPPAQQGAAQQ